MVVGGQLDSETLASQRTGLLSQGNRRIGLSAALALLLAAFVGLGWASRLWETL